jgi:hypothetical protein
MRASPGSPTWATVGAQVGLFSVGEQAGANASSLDVDYFRVSPP